MNEENEISLKELILILINDFKMIVTITAVFTILAIIVTFSMPKVYQTQSQISFNIPVESVSRFGIYKFYSQNIADYLSLLKSDEIKNEVANLLQISSAEIVVQVDFDNVSNYAIVKTTASNPEMAKEINDVLIETYINQLRAQYKVDAINRFINLETMNIKNQEFSLDKNKSLINELELLLEDINPVIILQKAIFSDPETAALYAKRNKLDLSSLSNNVILEENVNQKYLELESKIVDLKLMLINANEEIKSSNKLLIDLSIEKDETLKSLDKKNYELILNDELDVLNSSVIQTSKAIIPVNKTSPKNGLNILLGFFIGLTLSVFYSFFNYYWKTQK